jgi:hypothetical protein
MALVALGSVSREWHELARPFLWKVSPSVVSAPLSSIKLLIKAVE